MILDTTERKKIIENKIIDWITAKSGGQLTIFKPSNGKGVDLVAKKRGKYPGEGLNIQVITISERNNLYEKDIEEEFLHFDKNCYLIFVYFDLVEQDIKDYLWIVPSLEFRDTAETTTLDGRPALRFQVPIELEGESIYNRFLIHRKNLAQILVRILTSEDFKFPKTKAGVIRSVNLKELKKFITEARDNTYAGEGNPVDNPRLLGSTQLEYQKRDYFYRDIYFNGEKNFIGQEVIYQDNVPAWSMVYCGSNEPKEAFKFLKKALLNLSEECRFGGKCRFEDDEFLYEDNGEGILERFSGQEKILARGKEIYKLNYLGGLISK